MLVLDETGDAHKLSEVEGMLVYIMSHEEVFGKNTKFFTFNSIK